MNRLIDKSLRKYVMETDITCDAACQECRDYDWCCSFEGYGGVGELKKVRLKCGLYEWWWLYCPYMR